MKDTELQNAIGQLPRKISPQRDLWPGISARLGTVEQGAEARYRTPPWRTPAIAAAVLLALTTGIFIGRGMDGEPAVQPAQSMIQYAMAGTVEATEREYQAAFSELVPLDYSGLQLEGAQPEALRASWQDLQQAEALLLEALRQYPSNIYLNAKLLDLRSRQLQFARQMALLEQNNWRKT